MGNWIFVSKLIVFALISIYEFWAFRKRKTLKIKLLPIMLFGSIALILIALGGIIGYFVIFAILAVELSLMCSMLLVLSEVILTLTGSQRNFKKIFQLVTVFLLLALIYYLGERVF